MPPLLTLEYVSKTYGNEYESKKHLYAAIGVKYYVIYNPERVRGNAHQPLEIYRLENGEYVLQSSEPFWIPEAGLGIGRGVGTYRAWTCEWLYWFDQQGNRLTSSEERLKSLMARLRNQGIDPDTL